MGVLTVVVALGAVFALAVAVFLVQTVLRMRFQPPAYEVVGEGEVPEALRRVYAPGAAELAALGFEPLGWYRLRSVFASAWDTGYRPIFRAEDGVLALPELDDEMSSTRPVNLVFGSLFEGERWLVTHNHILHATVALDPTAAEQDGYLDTIGEQLALHRRRMSELDGAGHGRRRDAPLEELVASLEASGRRGVEALIASGRVVPAAGGHQYTVKAAMTKAWAVVTGGRGQPGPRSFFDAERLDVPLELKLQSWHRHEELHRRRGFRVAWRWVFALSVAATLVSFTGWFNLRVAVALVLVVALHEGGHYLAMRATGYQDVRVYLLPFLGGATMGQPGERTLSRELFVLLAGPLPGLLLGLAILAVPDAASTPWLSDIVTFLIGVNFINLLPVMPLDGGRIVNLVLGDLHPVIALGMNIGAVVVFLVAYAALQDAVLLVLACVMAVSLLTVSRVEKLARACARDGLRAPEDVLARLLTFPKMKDALVLPTMTQLMERLPAPRPRAAARVAAGLVYALALAGPFAAAVVVGIGGRMGRSITVPCADVLAPAAANEAAIPDFARVVAADFGSEAQAERVAAEIGVRELDRCPRHPWSALPPTEREVNARRTLAALRSADSGLRFEKMRQGPRTEPAKQRWSPLDSAERRGVADALVTSGEPWVVEELVAAYVASGLESLPPAAADLMGLVACEPTGAVVDGRAHAARVTVYLVGAESNVREALGRTLCEAGSESLLVH